MNENNEREGGFFLINTSIEASNRILIISAVSRHCLNFVPSTVEVSDPRFDGVFEPSILCMTPLLKETVFGPTLASNNRAPGNQLNNAAYSSSIPTKLYDGITKPLLERTPNRGSCIQPLSLWKVRSVSRREIICAKSC